MRSNVDCIVLQYGIKDLNKEALILAYLYPRLDANVSTGINHLLKSPFDPNNVQNFKLAEVPTLTKVINELGQVQKEKKEESGEIKSQEDDSIVSLPSLEPYLLIFKNHIRKCVIKQDKATLVGG